MVPFKFCGLWVGHDSTFEIDVVPFLNIRETRKHSSKTIFFTLISDGFSVLPRVSLSRGLSERMRDFWRKDLILDLHMTRTSQWSSMVLPGMFLLKARHESLLLLSFSPSAAIYT